MAEENRYITPEADKKAAQTFFNTAKAKGEAGQYEYAIDMFLEGIKKDPEAVDQHMSLFQYSLKRKVSGGKPLGMFDRMKIKNSKDDNRVNMVNAEKLLAYDPGNVDYMMQLFDAAVAGGFYDTAMWIGPILHRANAEYGPKANVAKFLSLRTGYVKMQQWKQAADAVASALQLKPMDMDLQTELKRLAAQQTIKEGNYQTPGGSFRDSIKDRDAQEALQRQDADVRTVDAMAPLIAAARADYLREPNEPGKINKLVELLVKSEDGERENEAIDILDQAYARTKQFRFRQQLGKVRLHQLKRMGDAIQMQAKANPTDAALAKDLAEFRKSQWEEEYKEFALVMENYPTDSVNRFEMAKRLFLLQRYDESIPLFQQTMNDPKLRVDATLMLGRAFFEATFLEEASDTFKTLTESYQITGDAKAKEMWYWYGRSLEGRELNPDAIKCYSKVAQWDFNYRDVQARIKRLRNRGNA